jgi:hypothetical protein
MLPMIRFRLFSGLYFWVDTFYGEYKTWFFSDVKQSLFTIAFPNAAWYLSPSLNYGLFHHSTKFPTHYLRGGGLNPGGPPPGLKPGGGNCPPGGKPGGGKFPGGKPGAGANRISVS